MDTVAVQFVINGYLRNGDRYEDVIVARAPDKSVAHSFDAAASAASRCLSGSSPGVAFAQVSGLDGEMWNALVLKRQLESSRTFMQTYQIGAPAQAWEMLLPCLPDLVRHIMSIGVQESPLWLPPPQLRISTTAADDTLGASSGSLLSNNVLLHPLHELSANWWHENATRFARFLPCLLSSAGVTITETTVEERYAILAATTALLPAPCRSMLTFASRVDTDEAKANMRILFQVAAGHERPVFDWKRGDFARGWEPEDALPLPTPFTGYLRSADGQQNLRSAMSQASRNIHPGKSLYLTFLRSFSADQPIAKLISDLRDAPSGIDVARAERLLAAVSPEFDTIADHDKTALAQLNWELVTRLPPISPAVRGGLYPALIAWQAMHFKQHPADFMAAHQKLETEPNFVVQLPVEFWSSVDVPNLVAEITRQGKDPGSLLLQLSAAELIAGPTRQQALNRWLQASESKEQCRKALVVWRQTTPEQDSSPLSQLDWPLMSKQLPATAELLQAIKTGHPTNLTFDNVATEIGDETLTGAMERIAIVNYSNLNTVRFATLMDAYAGAGQNISKEQVLQEFRRRSARLNPEQVRTIYNILWEATADEELTFRQKLGAWLITATAQQETWFDLAALNWRDFPDWSSVLAKEVKSARQRDPHSTPLRTFTAKCNNVVLSEEESVTAALVLATIASTRVEKSNVAFANSWGEPIYQDANGNRDLVDACSCMAELLGDNRWRTLVRKDSAGPEIEQALLEVLAHLSNSALAALYYGVGRSYDAQAAPAAFVALADVYHAIGNDKLLEEIVNKHPKSLGYDPSRSAPNVQKTHEELLDHGHKKLARQFRLSGSSTSSWVPVLVFTGLVIFLFAFGALGLLTLQAEITALRDQQQKLAVQLADLSASSSNQPGESRLLAIEERLQKIENTLNPSMTTPEESTGGAADTTPAATEVAPSAVVSDTVDTTGTTTTTIIGLIPVPTMVIAETVVDQPQETATDTQVAQSAQATLQDYQTRFPAGSNVVLVEPYLLREGDIAAERLEIGNPPTCTVTGIRLVESEVWAVLTCQPGDTLGWRLASDLSSP